MEAIWLPFVGMLYMPYLIMIAGPNGSGKTSAAPRILRDALEVVDYVNADVIAQGLSGFQPEKASIQVPLIASGVNQSKDMNITDEKIWNHLLEAYHEQ